MEKSFHINQFAPSNIWPKGGWSVYAITGDQIADRIIKKDGNVVARHSWCGYLGIADTWEGVLKLMQDGKR